MTKMTKAMWFEEIKAVVAAAEISEENRTGMLEFIEREKALLAKHSTRSGLTPRQKENLEVCAKIKDALFEMAKPVTITELMSGNAELSAYTSQKISALLKQMKERGEVIRTEEKKKAYFSLAE